MTASLRVSFFSASLLTAAVTAVACAQQRTSAPTVPQDAKIAKVDPYAREASLFERMDQVYHYEADGSGYKEINRSAFTTEN